MGNFFLRFSRVNVLPHHSLHLARRRPVAIWRVHSPKQQQHSSIARTLSPQQLSAVWKQQFEGDPSSAQSSAESVTVFDRSLPECSVEFESLLDILHGPLNHPTRLKMCGEYASNLRFYLFKLVFEKRGNKLLYQYQLLYELSKVSECWKTTLQLLINN